MDILIKAAQLILALIILVTVHEFGHYIFARIFGVKVNRFYLFFNPYFSLLRYDPMKGTLDIFARNGKPGTFSLRVGKEHVSRPDGRPTWRDTVYGLGWVPLGGYCDIAGMVDETKDASKLAAEPQSWELRSKPAWQRLCVMVAGVVLNFVLAIIIYTGIAFHWGDRVIPFQAMTEGMDFSNEFVEAGFRNGDILQSIDGKAVDAKDYSVTWDLIQPGTSVGVLRNGEPVEISISDALIRQIATKGKEYMPMTMRVPVVVAKTMNGEPAALAGIEPGDRILAVGNDTTPAITEFTKEGAQSLGGFGTLGDLFPSAWNWYSFWQITAFLSIILAFMNIIPIPGLDGGYTLFLLVEMITGRKPSDKFLEIVNTCGFAFLLLLLVYANGNDIYRFFLK